MSLILWLALGVAPAFAAEGMAPLPPAAPAARELAWEDCVAIAAEKNPSLVSSRYAKGASRASYLKSFNGLLPTLSLSNSYSSSKGSEGRASYSAAASAGLTLFDMGDIASIRSAAAGYSQSEASLRQASANLRYSLRQAFVEAYMAERNVEVARKILEIRGGNAERVALKYQSGKEYKGSMLSAQAQHLRAQAALAAAQRGLRTARRGLDQQLGLDDFAEVAATGTLTAAAPPELPADLSALVDGRPDVLLQEAVIKSQRASVASARSSLWPTLSASYSRTRGGAAEFPSATYGWSAGAVLSLPVFGSGPTSTYFAVQGAQRNLDKAQQDLRAARNAALVDLEESWAAYANAADGLRVAEASRDASRQRNAEAEIRYASGLLSFDNWEVIVSEWVSAEQSALQARSGAVTAQAAWEKALGKALGE